jgi:hypothetical protein
MLRVDSVGTLALVGFEGFDPVARLLHRSSYKSANGMFFPSQLVHDFFEGRPVLTLEHGDHFGGFAALARPGSFLRLGSLLGRGGLFSRLALGGRFVGPARATRALLVRLLLPGLRLGIRSVAKSLDTRPDSRGGGSGTRKLGLSTSSVPASASVSFFLP